jgi:hypothetical protein
MAGALIVFFTLIVKDGKQAHLREEIDSIKSARRSLNIVSAVLRTDSGPRPVVDTPGKRRFFSGREELLYGMFLNQQLWSTLSTIDRSSPTCQATEEALIALSDDKSALALSAEWAASLKRLLQMEKAVSARLNPTTLPYPSLQSQSENLAQARQGAEDLKVAIWELDERMLRHAQYVSASALSNELALQVTYTDWEYIGYGLYIVGWFLALLGQFLKPNEPPDSPELTS